jgi:predicted outer membrane protein
MRISVALSSLAALGLASACDQVGGGSDPAAAIPENELPEPVAQLDAQIGKAQEIVELAGDLALAGRLSSESALERSGDPDIRALAEWSAGAYRNLEDALTVASGAAVLAPPPPAPSAALAARLESLPASQGEEFDRLYLALQTELLSGAQGRLEAYSRDGSIEPLKVFASESLPQIRDVQSRVNALSNR